MRPVADRQFTEEERNELARKGHALPDGSYPCPDCDAVTRHLKAYRRAPESHRGPLAALLRKRDDELRCGLDLGELDTG